MSPMLLNILTVLLVAASPISELRGSIPLGVGVFGMPIVAVAILSILGNLIPVLLVYGIGGAWIRWTRSRQGWYRRLTDAVLHRSEKRFSGQYLKYGMIALPIFVGIPLPLTGAWTGAIAAFLIGIPFRKAFPLIGLGVVIAATLVSLATVGVIAIV